MKISFNSFFILSRICYAHNASNDELMPATKVSGRKLSLFLATTAIIVSTVIFFPQREDGINNKYRSAYDRGLAGEKIVASVHRSDYFSYFLYYCIINKQQSPYGAGAGSVILQQTSALLSRREPQRIKYRRDKSWLHVRSVRLLITRTYSSLEHCGFSLWA